MVQSETQQLDNDTATTAQADVAGETQQEGGKTASWNGNDVLSVNDWAAQRDALIAAAEQEAIAESQRMAAGEQGEAMTAPGAKPAPGTQTSPQTAVDKVPMEEAEDGRAKKVRYRPKNDVEALALQLQYEEGNEFKPLAELLALAEAQLNTRSQVQSGPGVEAQKTPEKPANPWADLTPEEVQAESEKKYDDFYRLQAEAAKLRKESAGHIKDFEYEDGQQKADRAAELELQALEAHRLAREAEKNIALAAQRENAELEAFRASEAAVIAKYPGANDPNGLFNQRYLQIGEAWKQAGDPRVYQTNTPEIIADIVALELGMKAAPPQQQKPRGAQFQQPVPASQLSIQQRPTRAAPIPAPAPGSATRDNRSPADSYDLDSIRTPAQYEAFKRSIGLGGF